jgi:hypothetical protein
MKINFALVVKTTISEYRFWLAVMVRKLYVEIYFHTDGFIKKPVSENRFSLVVLEYSPIKRTISTDL